MSIFNFLICSASISTSSFCAVLFFAVPAFADSNWKNSRFTQNKHSSSMNSHPAKATHAYSSYGYSTYKGYADPYGTPLPKHHPNPIRPPVNHQPPYYPNYPHPSQRPYPIYPQHNGVTIIYNHSYPTQTEYRTESQGFVNGDPHGQIESSSYMLISDWQRYHLPAPNVGMHWIYQQGHYLQVPNDR